MNGSALTWVFAAMILASLVLAVATDLVDRVIPNGLVLVVLCSCIGLRVIQPGAFWPSVLAAGAVLAVLSPLGANDLLGWGDVKLISAATFAVEVNRVLPMLLAIALAGGVLSGIYLTLRFFLRRGSSLPGCAGPQSGRTSTLGILGSREAARILAGGPMPYAVAVLGGVAYIFAAG